MTFQEIKDIDEKKTKCIQKKDNDEWENIGCITKIVEDEINSSDKNKVECDCKDLHPTTIINDFEDILGDNNSEEVFSQKGLESLQKFEFWKSYMFYCLFGVHIIYFYTLYQLYLKDLKDAIEHKIELPTLDKEEQPEENLSEKQI